MTQPQTQTTVRPVSGWLKALFFVSLAFNLMIIGAIGAGMYFAPHMANMPAMGRHAPLARPGALFIAGRNLIHQVPLRRKIELMQVLRANRQSLAQGFRDIADARLNLARTLTQKPFDRARFERALEAVKAAERRTHEQGQNLTRDFILALTDKERAAFARLLTNPPRRHRMPMHMR